MISLIYDATLPFSYIESKFVRKSVLDQQTSSMICNIE